MMPNKTIYVADDDLPLYQRAQELAGGNLSAAITKALRRFIELEEARRAGFDEITVRVGSGRGRKVRFAGVLLGEWGHSTGSRVEVYKVFRTRTGKFALHVERSPDAVWTSPADDKGWFGSWRKYLGLNEQSWGTTPGEGTLQVVATLAELCDKIPVDFYDLIVAAADEPAVEELDI